MGLVLQNTIWQFLPLGLLLRKPAFDYAPTWSAVFKDQALINSLLQKDMLSSNMFGKPPTAFLFALIYKNDFLMFWFSVSHAVFVDGGYFKFALANSSWTPNQK